MNRITPFAVVLVAVVAVGACKKRDDSISDDGRSKSKGSATPVSERRTAAYREASRSMHAIETRSRETFQMEYDESGTGVGPFDHRFCPDSVKPVPTTVPTVPTQTKSEDWDAPTWKCLKFSLSEPILCQYAYSTNGKIGLDAEYTATAVCDPDGDGRLLRFELKGKAGPSGEVKRISFTIHGDEGMGDPLKAEHDAERRDWARAIEYLEALADIVDRDRGDCARMGRELKAWTAKNGDDMKAVEKKIKDASSMSEFQHAYDKRLEAATTKFVGTGECMSNADVASAMKSLD